jgi:hypothetical protein
MQTSAISVRELSWHEMQWDNKELVRLVSHIVWLSPPQAVAASGPACPGRWTEIQYV